MKKSRIKERSCYFIFLRTFCYADITNSRSPYLASVMAEALYPGRLESRQQLRAALLRRRVQDSRSLTRDSLRKPLVIGWFVGLRRLSMARHLALTLLIYSYLSSDVLSTDCLQVHYVRVLTGFR